MIGEPSDLAIAANEVHLWWIDLTPLHAAERLLSPPERTRAARFRQARERERWIAARAALRHTLARYTALPPDALPLVAGAHGKPAIAGASPIRFSLSHAADRALLAVTWRRDVGVDLEPRDPDVAGVAELERLIAVACNVTEASWLRNLPPPERGEAFVRLWTFKEAYLKGVGRGLQWEPRDLEVVVDERGRARVRRGSARSQRDHAADPSRWTFRLLDAGGGWIAALAIVGPAPKVVERHWPAPPSPTS